jgi:hypothetical protein
VAFWSAARFGVFTVCRQFSSVVESNSPAAAVTSGGNNAVDNKSRGLLQRRTNNANVRPTEQSIFSEFSWHCVYWTVILNHGVNSSELHDL